MIMGRGLSLAWGLGARERCALSITGGALSITGGESNFSSPRTSIKKSDKKAVGFWASAPSVIPITQRFCLWLMHSKSSTLCFSALFSVDTFLQKDSSVVTLECISFTDVSTSCNRLLYVSRVDCSVHIDDQVSVLNDLNDDRGMYLADCCYKGGHYLQPLHCLLQRRLIRVGKSLSVVSVCFLV